MVKIIAVANGKGGTGKTTTTINLAAGLRQLGFRPLIVDLDGQANATMATGVMVPDDAPTIYDAFARGVHPQVFPGKTGLDVIPSDRRMYRLDRMLSFNGANAPDLLAEALSPLKERYDFILLDCPPAFGLAATSAMKVADHIVLVANMSEMTIRTTKEVADLLAASKEISGRRKVLGMILTMNRYTSENKKVADMVSSVHMMLPFGTKIRMTTYLSEAAAMGMDIFSYFPECPGAQDYLAVTKELLARINCTRNGE